MRTILNVLYLTLLLLVSAGLLLVYSACTTQPHGALKFILVQLAAIIVGVLAIVLINSFEYRDFKHPMFAIVVGVISFLIMLAPFGFPAVNGSHRWINLGPISIQPSEFARIGIVFVLSSWFERIPYKASRFVKGFAIPGLIFGILVAPIFLSPDLGASCVALVSAGSVFLAAGTRKRYLIPAALIALAAGVALIISSPNRLSRVMSHVDSIRGIESDNETSYQSKQATEAFVRGGTWGVGLNKSVQKYRYLPEAHTDFIYAIAGEEFGMVGALALIILYITFLVCGSLIARFAADRFGRLLALGLTVLLSFEASFNVGMVLGCFPTKGLALPFISYGGSSMLASLITVGLIINVGRTTLLEKEYDEVPIRDAMN